MLYPVISFRAVLNYFLSPRITLYRTGPHVNKCMKHHLFLSWPWIKSWVYSLQRQEQGEPPWNRLAARERDIILSCLHWNDCLAALMPALGWIEWKGLSYITVCPSIPNMCFQVSYCGFELLLRTYLAPLMNMNNAWLFFFRLHLRCQIIQPTPSTTRA